MLAPLNNLQDPAGLLGKSVLEAAEVDREPIPWCVRVNASLGTPGRLEALQDLMRACWRVRPEARPTVPDLLEAVEALLAEEVAAG
jgi:hypothetical protein